MSTKFFETTDRELAFHEARRYQNTMKKTNNSNTIIDTAKKTAMPIYEFESNAYCKSVDVLTLIHHEQNETDNDDVRSVLYRMESRLLLGLLYDPDKTKRNYSQKIPGRYAVGYREGDRWYFYVGARRDHSAAVSARPCEAKLYEAFRTASACADFIDDGHPWQVLDWYDNMTEEERWRRDITEPFPYDLDEGCENALPLTIVS